MGIIGDWINRKRHNRGYGIQSPSSFFFITQVLKEPLPYYAYPTLTTIAKEEGFSTKRLKELFRITNYHKPQNCIALCSPAVACAMTTARPSVDTYCITDKNPCKRTANQLTENRCKIIQGNITDGLAAVLGKVKNIGILYIGNIPDRAELLEAALRYTNENSLIVIDGIHKDRLAKEWWQDIIDNPATIVTYDMYSYGLLYFNKERYKQNYTLKR